MLRGAGGCAGHRCNVVDNGEEGCPHFEQKASVLLGLRFLVRWNLLKEKLISSTYLFFLQNFRIFLKFERSILCFSALQCRGQQGGAVSAIRAEGESFYWVNVLICWSWN